MTLLQIQEPEETPTSSRPLKLAVGIDLGTTNSVVAAVREGGAVSASDSQNRTIMPSAVHYAKDGTITAGHEALSKRAEDPKNVICSAKRLMGRGAADTGESYRYDYADGGGMAVLRTAAGDKSPVEVSAEILRHLRRQAESFFGESVAGAVVTVPAYFDDAQRQATKDAARLAGLHLYRLLGEPTAAAVAYGLDDAEEGDYLVYDLGGGTFDVSVLRMRKGVFTVLAAAGDTALGGDDFDRILMRLAHVKTGAPPLSAEDELRFAAAAREIKEHLTTEDMAMLRAPGGVECEIGAAEFETASSSLVKSTISCCERALSDAGVLPSDIKQAVLVGGATRMPMIKKAVSELFGRPPFDKLNPDETVALGAAAQADLLSGNRRDDNWLLLDVIPLSLGLETMGGLAEKVIPRNTAIPIEKSQEFTTHQDGQTGMSIHVVQGERELVRDCRSLAQFTLSGIPPMSAGLARVRVEFRVDADGLLSVSATERETGVRANVSVKPAYGLDEAQILSMLDASFAVADEDAELRRAKEASLEGESILRAVEKAVADSPELLSAEEKARIENALSALKKSLGGDSHREIHAAIKELDKVSEDFAARKMNAEIQSVLAGKKADEV